MLDESHLSILAQGTQQGHAVLDQAAATYKQILGKRLAAAYALGSLAHGGFSPLVSDVDLALILADPLRPSYSVTVAAVAWGLKAKGSALHERLSVFWGTPSSLAGRVPGGRFPPLDRLDLLEHGCLLRGEDARSGLVPPGRDELSSWLARSSPSSIWPESSSDRRTSDRGWRSAPCNAPGTSAG